VKVKKVRQSQATGQNEEASRISGWNPAVEAQAVDRAHRIGQIRPIFTYRLIARDTVEEKVLELQKTKRDLAAAIIGAENSMIRDLRSEDLELLLS
jgi:SNF2 family DNA or RNA helicase